ncbi:MAG: SHOCT domain-containing protein, partial [Acidimicrobiales bacterium]
GWMWLWGTAMMVLFVLLIVWLVRATVGHGGGSASGPQNSSSRARAILDERYAKGDLSTEEYRERSGELD